MKRLILSILTAASLCAHAQPDIIRIGVLAKRGTERCLEKWGPTADYLTEHIPEHRFEIVPLNFQEIFIAAENESVNFILTNPSIYVELDVRFKAMRIATLNNLGPLGNPCSVFGGVILFRKDRIAEPTWNDLRKKRIAAVDPASFGGWLTALREIKGNGLRPDRHFTVDFLGTHDAVVYAVRDGQADGGVVRTDTLERMAAEGKIKLTDFSILPCPGDKYEFHDEFTNLHSTRLYPEWPMARLKSTSNELAQKVAFELMEMPADNPAAKAALCAGWLIPFNYTDVETCLKELQVRPFENYGVVSLGEALRQHWPWVSAFILLMAGLLLALTLAQTSRKRAKESHAFMRSIIDSIPDNLMVLDPDYRILTANRSVRESFGEDPVKACLACHQVSHLSDVPCTGEDDPCPLRVVLETGEPETAIHRHPQKDGTDRYVEVTASPIRNEKGETTSIIEYCRDITGRVLAKQALEESEEYLRTVIETIEAGVLIIRQSDRVILDANPAVIKMSGYPSEQVIGTPCFNILCPASSTACPVLDMNQQVDDSERTMITAGGARMPILKTVKKTVLKGEPVLVESFVDITD